MSDDIVTRLRLRLMGDGFANPEETRDAADEIERLRASLHDIAEHLGNALYSDEWRTREYAIVAFGIYERAYPEHERDIDKMVNQ